MDAFNQLKAFYKKANKDKQLRPSHLSIYFGLLWVWQENKFAASFNIYRKNLMIVAHIQSIATYHKCIKELMDLGYIIYEPSYNYYRGCRITLLNGK